MATKLRDVRAILVTLTLLFTISLAEGAYGAVIAGDYARAIILDLFIFHLLYKAWVFRKLEIK